MKKILIIGCCGSGKTTLAHKMHKILDLELIHLDTHYWLPNWNEPTKEDWLLKVQTLLLKPNWIMDGNFSGTMDIRIKEADTIIFLDFPTIKCLYRIIKRVATNWGTVRPDMTEGCKEKIDLPFLHFVASFNRKKRGTIISKLKKVQKNQQDKQVLIFNNNTQISNFVDGLSG